MGISEEKMKIVINNYFKSECDVNTSIREAFEKGFRIGVKKGLTQSKADTPQTDCDKCIWSVCNYNKVEWDADTPQTDCAWMYDSRRDYEYDKALDELERNE